MEAKPDTIRIAASHREEIAADRADVFVTVSGYPLVQVEGPEELSGPYRLTASFFNQHGLPSLFIRQIEWKVISDSWDVEVTGPSITVRTRPGEIALRLVFVPGEGLVVEKLGMFCAGYHFLGNGDELHVRMPNGSSGTLTRCLFDNANVGLSLG